MKLSFCIPTFNRCQFLKKNIDIIIRQIRELSVENDVEILINDNASPDNTEELCKQYIDDNPDIHIEFHKNAKNEGPDWNFIKAMRLAHGEYSILFGDDDFLIEGSLKTIFQLIEDYKEISIFLSNRVCVNVEGDVITEQKFLDVPREFKIFDFSNEDSVRSFFYGVRTLGGIMTFITSVIYKTSILNKFTFKNEVIGSNYAFLYYWWKELTEGNKLYYLNKSLVLATTTGSTNNNYGIMVDRVSVDYKGLLTISKHVFDNSIISKYFLRAIDADHSDLSLLTLYLIDKKKFENTLEPYLLQTCWDHVRLRELKFSASLESKVHIFLYKHLPANIISVLKKMKR